MARLEIGGRAFEIAPYKLGALRRAAPYIDRINANAGALGTIEGMTDSTADIVAVLSIGLQKLDPALTPEALEEMVGFDDLPALRDAFVDVLRESGMRAAGEAPAPSPAGGEGASTRSSALSSTS
jgi:hypothetical protein